MINKKLWNGSSIWVIPMPLISLTWKASLAWISVFLVLLKPISWIKRALSAINMWESWMSAHGKHLHPCTSNSMPHKIFFIFYVLVCCSTIQAEALLRDTGFQRGYAVMSPQKDIYTNRVDIEAIHLLYSGENEFLSTPDWRLVQWGSEYSLGKSPSFSIEKSGKRWEVPIKNSDASDIYKAITLNTEGELILELNGATEFNGRYLESLVHYWPHLLMAQDIRGKKLDKYRLLEFSLEARLLFDHKNQSEGYREGIHAARFPVAIAVRNTLTGNMFGLSLVIYDDRYPQSSFICKKCNINMAGEENCYIPEKLEETGRWECPFDGNRWSKAAEKTGTRKIIFRIPTEAATKNNIHGGEWTHYQIDLLPYIQAGIQ